MKVPNSLADSMRTRKHRIAGQQPRRTTAFQIGRLVAAVLGRETGNPAPRDPADLRGARTADRGRRTPRSVIEVRITGQSRANRLDTAPQRPANIAGLDGRVAQRESTPFTRVGSQVQSLSRPPALITENPRLSPTAIVGT